MKSTANAAFGPLIRKLDGSGRLDDDDRVALAELPFHGMTVPPNTHLVRKLDRMTECCLLISGFAFCSKVAPNGQRQIVSFHMAGDVLDLQRLVLGQANLGVQTATEATVAWIPISALNALIKDRPKIGWALWCNSLIEASISREWIRNVGQRNAKSRIAHMLCEFALRQEAAGLGAPDRFGLPMSQEHIGDATGLSAVHVNRMLMALAADGVIARDKRDVKITDWERMRRVAGFDSKYLHVAV